MSGKTVQINFRGTPMVKQLLEMLANAEGISEGQYLCKTIINNAQNHLASFAKILAIGDAAEACGLPEGSIKGISDETEFDRLEGFLKKEVYDQFLKSYFEALVKRIRYLEELMGVTPTNIEEAFEK